VLTHENEGDVDQWNGSIFLVEGVSSMDFRRTTEEDEGKMLVGGTNEDTGIASHQDAETVMETEEGVLSNANNLCLVMLHPPSDFQLRTLGPVN